MQICNISGIDKGYYPCNSSLHDQRLHWITMIFFSNYIVQASKPALTQPLSLGNGCKSLENYSLILPMQRFSMLKSEHNSVQ